MEKFNEKKIISDGNINMRILSGFILALGITAVAIAFITLNTRTFGVMGLVVASAGASAALLGGVGLFKYAPETGKLSQKMGSQQIIMTPMSGANVQTT